MQFLVYFLSYQFLQCAALAVSAPDTVHLSCHSLGRDVAFKDGVALVSCPDNCQRATSALTIGVSIHPMSSPVCASAIADGILPTAGGELVVSKAAGLAAYTSKNTGVVVAQPGTDDGEGAFYVYASNTIDQINGNVRLVDASGALSSAGLLQVRSDRGWGSVCGINAGAADVACRAMGYQRGSIATSPCSFYGGSDLCGAVGTSVAMQGVECTGGEIELSECVWTSPDDSCRNHLQDSILQCYDGTSPMQAGSLRLLASDGAPSLTGDGRLEMFHSNGWTPVCASGFSAGAEAVACRQMGFAAAVGSKSCASSASSGSCGTLAPRIAEMACSGAEDSLIDCQFEEGQDVFCAPEESLILSCAGGHGDTQGRSAKAAAPSFDLATFPSETLACESTLVSVGMSSSNPGTTFLGVCGACDAFATPVAGSYIYTPESSLCNAAIHAAVIGPEGGTIVVTVGFGQEEYFGSASGSVESQNHGKERRSFTVSKPAGNAHLRSGQRSVESTSAGTSTFGKRA